MLKLYCSCFFTFLFYKQFITTWSLQNSSRRFAPPHDVTISSKDAQIRSNTRMPPPQEALQGADSVQVDHVGQGCKNETSLLKTR